MNLSRGHPINNNWGKTLTSKEIVENRYTQPNHMSMFFFKKNDWSLFEDKLDKRANILNASWMNEWNCTLMYIINAHWMEMRSELLFKPQTKCSQKSNQLMLHQDREVHHSSLFPKPHKFSWAIAKVPFPPPLFLFFIPSIQHPFSHAGKNQLTPPLAWQCKKRFDVLLESLGGNPHLPLIWKSHIIFLCAPLPPFLI